MSNPPGVVSSKDLDQEIADIAADEAACSFQQGSALSSSDDPISMYARAVVRPSAETGMAVPSKHGPHPHCDEGHPPAQSSYVSAAVAHDPHGPSPSQHTLVQGDTFSRTSQISGPAGAKPGNASSWDRLDALESAVVAIQNELARQATMQQRLLGLGGKVAAVTQKVVPPEAGSIGAELQAATDQRTPTPENTLEHVAGVCRANSL